jgi:hypothetical protein
METQAPADLDTVRLCRAANILHALARTCSPALAWTYASGNTNSSSATRNPDRGRIYINYLTGEVSWQRPVWTYYGYLKGYAQAPEADPDSEPPADAQTILRALCGDDENNPAS